MKLAFAAIFFSISCMIISCKKAKDDSVAPQKDSDLVVLDYPSYLPAITYDFKANPLSKRKIELGRMLFYDPILSRDSTISCASCHQPFAAFSHLAHSTSHGIDRQLGNRNAPGLYNLAWAPGFMWDGAVPNIEVQSVAPITNHLEMDETILNVLRKLNKHPVYSSKFKLAFETEKIESAQMLKSLAQFMLTIVSFNTKYDAYKAGKATLETSELEGMVIVQQKCTPCHGGELFTDFSFRNIGLDSTSGDPDDIGRQAFTGQPSDRRKFKVPSLRNFTNTYPYFHNGISNSLESVLKRHGIQDNPNLDPLLKGNVGFGLTPLEVNKIYDFISTLTDNTILQNPAFLTPFDSYVVVH